MNYEYPSTRRALLALILAPIPPVVLLFAFDAFDRAMTLEVSAIAGAALLAVYTLIVAEVIAVVFGGIALVALWYKVRFSFSVALLVGGAVAALPIAILVGLSSIDIGGSGTYSASYNGHLTVINNVKTGYGMWRDFIAFSLLFGLGTLGGATFWLVCRTKKAMALAEE